MTKYELPLGDEMNPNESGFSVILYKKLIRNWHEKATTEDYFSKFVFEYLAFNAIIIQKFPSGTGGKDRHAIQGLKSDDNIKQEYLKKINQNKDLEKLIEYLNKSPFGGDDELKWWNCSDPGPCNVPDPGYQTRGTIRDNNDWENMVEFIYSVRNNLFHGGKDLEDKRDQLLVRHAYKLLRPLVEILLHSKGMGGEIDED